MKGTEQRMPSGKRGEYRKQHRRARGEAKPGLLWQDRDTDLLHAVWVHRWLTRDLLLILHPPAEPPAHLADRKGPAKQPGTNLDRRLAKLFHHGFLDRTRTEYGGPIIYGLTKLGADKLTGELNRREQSPTPQDTNRLDERNRTAKAATIDHALAIARVRVSLIAGMRGTPWTVDRFNREGEDLKAEWKSEHGRRYVIPDAFVVLKDESAPSGKQRHAVFLEIDRSTMKASKMAEKFQRYSELYQARMHQTYYGVPTFRVLTITKSAERANNLRKLVRGEFIPPHHSKPLAAPVPTSHRPFYYFTDESTFEATPANILAAVWTRADDHQAVPDRVAIIPKPLPLVR